MPSKIEFKDGFAVGYAFAIPEAFRDALTRDAFSTGDVFYDDRAAYLLQWREALSKISVVLKIVDILGGRVRFVRYRPDPIIGTVVRLQEETVPSEIFGLLLKNGL